MKAVILDYQTLAPNDLALDTLWQQAIDWQLYDTTPADQTAERIKDMDIVLTNKVVLDEALLNANPNIRLIIILATGTNNVDLQAARKLGIPVCNIVAYSTESVVQHTFACLLSLVNRLRDYDRALAEKRWQNGALFTLLDYPVEELAGKTMGIIGYGAIGKRVADVAIAFGMQVVVAQSLTGANKQQQERLPLPQLLQQADVISLHCPLSPLSENLIDAKALAMMKTDAIVLNMARGGVVHEQALLQALLNGQIRAAACDVLTQEPPPADHILLQQDMPNLLITPHMAWGSRQARQQLLDQVLDILQSFADNRLINRVNN